MLARTFLILEIFQVLLNGGSEFQDSENKKAAPMERLCIVNDLNRKVFIPRPASFDSCRWPSASAHGLRPMALYTSDDFSGFAAHLFFQTSSCTS